ncbi:hypothetical protein HG536_0D02740 [Torulaspora globosa]|uniref:Uncharacterized protein n=1 Tax=Torulaspora globosa TaxID=48254 RepID=A0A7G3ZGW6_9SACH|nr:uncharacterized protein HG536_0D02740 [Torulaspora globosa]QLL32752.1 hypothetical protein HG536_0D02740 [Torulaspora globosa]
MRWFASKLLVLLSLASLVWGNTESFFLKVPKDFPIRPADQKDGQFTTVISLEHSNNAKITYEAEIGRRRLEFIELQHLQVDETYQVKICWSALDPISIGEMDWFIVPHSTSFEGTVSEGARIFIQFAVTNDSYPPMEAGTVVPINVSVINCKLGIPVDLYGVIIYIAIIVASVAFLSKKINLCGMIRR